MLYSPKTGGFYDPTIHKVWPDDAIEISDEGHGKLLEALSAGQLIEMIDGAPRAVEPAQPSAAARTAQLRRKRDKLLAASDYTQLPDAPLTAAQKTAWGTYRQQLRDLPETFDNPADVDWPRAPKEAAT